MLSGTDEPECPAHPSEVVPAVGASVSGADRVSPRPAASPESAHDPPHCEATTISARVTFRPSGNGKATAGRFAGSTAVI
jgi:hypothetical protein